MRTDELSRTVYRNANAATDTGTRTPPRAPVRAMQVLEALANSPMSLGALSVELGMPKTSAMHMLRALEAAAYVRRTAAGFELGMASHRLAARIGSASDFESTARQVLQEVAELTGETALIGTFSQDRNAAVYKLRVVSPHPVRFAPEVGDTRPLYASALGKLLLAYAPGAFVDDYLKRVRMDPITSRTVTSRKQLLQRLKQVRAEGVCVSIDEMAEGGSGLVAPIFDGQGSVELALVLAAPTSRAVAGLERLREVVQHAAERLSALQGFVTDTEHR
ncbi:bacterial transcriptional regulator family protein [Paraburkholderia xenovorans LB400]|uniref:Transcriptional regulator, IclR family n=2 Tax=Paraburkholderia xenovorans TaxID=36873 RepID=Q13GY1_PARXL|nr:transcriptional regulator, IclR family [Paraburkholderia xenovorans LB400]AIP34838.1 bacterial transcriptional regulator family protein [Paraburkholderia xenovorans LB400]